MKGIFRVEVGNTGCSDHSGLCVLESTVQGSQKLGVGKSGRLKRTPQRSVDIQVQGTRAPFRSRASSGK